jgi:hypothetical protein
MEDDDNIDNNINEKWENSEAIVKDINTTADRKG